jgi:CheY-like chemotaxis protein
MSQILPRAKHRLNAFPSHASPSDLVRKLVHFCCAFAGVQGNVYFSDKNDSGHLFNGVNDEFLDESELEGTSCVLYIEDNPSNLRLVQTIFEKFPDVRLLSAPTAESGLKLLNENAVDLILLDINLPGMSGYEALQQLQHDDKTKDITVLAVSASAGLHDIEKGMLAGFKHYITKPINVDAFIDVINMELNFEEE